ncbi:DNA-3-methyladenine glycosylase I [Moritella sp. F3]|uniref:DNA-3-methyladenine glycosylase I n=1 Tax=Moritella sp. F3 TaxID=2718882 RepID=UPI0018E17BEC|nr:DNA-3-methyladenine glycosylase I [Moritella sp. F3]GIC75558.1 DNA-3-methyladenine glycosylase [Moritella sp. F1]GIC80703.1 DNA-3-methyladenine glycosylase [Moritella sp. F3]
MKNRCTWCGDDPLYVSYHDEEWGVPVHDEQRLFEFLVLEGAQAGLSWITILRKRENYRDALHQFNYKVIANYSEDDVNRLLANEGIVRNKLKIRSVIKNAQGFLNIQAEFGSFDAYIWGFVKGVTQQNNLPSLAETPVKTDISEAISKDLKKRGFNFVGPTICYAFMQAIGMVNDHTTDCFCHQQIKA